MIILLILSIHLNAQRRLDTIYANRNKNVALFFPSPIRQGISGSTNFVFTYNREAQQHFGLLQAQPGTESNLLVVTNDRKVYSYILTYEEELPKLNYFISETESIGTEMPLIVDWQPNKRELDSITERKQFFKRFSEYLLKSKKYRLATKRKKGIRLQLQRMVYHGSETYLIVEISNRSGIDFEVDYLKVYIVNGNKKRKSSYQEHELKPVYVYHQPDKVWNGRSFQFVFALPKFVLGDHETLQLELSELNGHRKVILQKPK